MTDAVPDAPPVPAAVIVLAAGAGTRMKSTTPKVLHPLAGRSMLGHAMVAARDLSPQRIAVVVRHERDLVAAWHAALVGHGVGGYTGREAWEDYRFAMLQGPLVSVFGCAYGTRTERGDRMFAAMVARSCAAIRDLGVLSLVAGDC